MAVSEIEFVRDPIRHLFLNRRVLAAVPAGPIQYQAVVAEKLIILRQINAVTTTSCRRTGESGRNIRTARIKRFRVVDHALVIKHECHVEGRVVQPMSRGPGAQRVLRHPNSICREIARRLNFADAHKTFARRSVVGERGRGARRETIRRSHIKRHHRTARLRGNGRRENPVLRDRVTADAGVVHVHAGETRVWIKAITQLQCGDAVRIMHARRDDEIFISRRQHGRMLHLGDRRTDVRRVTTVHRARRARTDGQGHFTGALEPIATQAEENFRMSSQPTHVRANRDILRAGAQGRSQRRANTIHLIVAALDCNYAIRPRAFKTFRRVPSGQRLRAFRRPAGGVALERRIGDEIHAAAQHLHIINQTLACALQQHLQLIRRDIAVINRAGRREQFPRRFLRFIAVRPV